jgi:starch phosphorylase
VRTAYAPLGLRGEAMRRDGFAGAREKAARDHRLREAWDGVRIEDVSVTDQTRGSLGVGDVFEVRARVQLGGVAPEDLSVELYVGRNDPAGNLDEPVVIPLLLDGDVRDGVAQYSGAYLPRGAGTFLYGVRVLPEAPNLTDAAHLGLVRWA